VIRAGSFDLSMKAAFGVVLALVLAMRLLAPAGFMPDFARGTVSIIACPDAGAPTPPGHHSHHDQPKKTHSPCPYAAGGAVASLTDAATQLLVILFGAALLAWRTFLFIQRSRNGERPPVRGPPVPA